MSVSRTDLILKNKTGGMRMSKKLVIGHSGVGKSWFLITEASDEISAGNRVLYVRREMNELLDEAFNEDFKKIVGDKFEEISSNENLKFLDVSKDVTELNLEEIRREFTLHEADVVFVDGVESLLTKELFEGAKKVVHTSQRYPKSDAGIDLTTFDIVELGEPVRPVNIDVTKLNVVSIDAKKA